MWQFCIFKGNSYLSKMEEMCYFGIQNKTFELFFKSLFCIFPKLYMVTAFEKRVNVNILDFDGKFIFYTMG